MRFVVYNPQSNGGATGRHWLEIAKLVEAAIGPFSSAPTCCRDDAARLVREAVANGAQEVVAVGGDGVRQLSPLLQYQCKIVVAGWTIRSQPDLLAEQSFGAGKIALFGCDDCKIATGGDVGWIKAQE